MYEIRMSDGILNWISAFVFSLPLSLSLSFSLYLAFCLFLLVALFAGQFQATPQDRPQNAILASWPTSGRWFKPHTPFYFLSWPLLSWPVPSLPVPLPLIAVACQKICQLNKNIFLLLH